MKENRNVIRTLYDPRISRIEKILVKFCPKFLNLYASIYGIFRIDTEFHFYCAFSDWLEFTFGLSFINLYKGYFRNNVTVLGDQWFCDKSTKASVDISLTVGEGASKIVKNASRHLCVTTHQETETGGE